MRKARLVLALTTLSAWSCIGPGDDSELVETGLNPIVNGTREPEAVELREGQKLALGWLHERRWTGGNFCTGTLIAPRVVVTAAHCTIDWRAFDIGFGVGLLPNQPVASFDVDRKIEHPSEDVALLILEEDAVARVPQLEPVPFNRSRLGREWVGRDLQAGGFGMTRDPDRVGRYFATLRVHDLRSSSIVMNGRGLQGVCFGDSGGPLFAKTAPEQVSVLAVVHGGEDSCLGFDEFSRLDTVADWIHDVTGELLGSGQPGRAPRPVGVPNVDPGLDPPPAADDGRQQPAAQEPEPGGLEDACDGLDFQGDCQGSVARWCDDNQLREVECQDTGHICRWVNGQTGYYCAPAAAIPDPPAREEPAGRAEADCGDLDYYGVCDGTLVRWCADGQISELDCSSVGGACGWVDDEIGNYCVSFDAAPVEEDPVDDACGGVDYRGYCDADVAIWCSGDQLQRMDCAAQGQGCGWVDDATGFYCQG